MTRETGPEMLNPELYKGKEDSTKVANTDFKKAGHLNISVLCSICHEEVRIKQLFHHKRAHQAQATLSYQYPWNETLNVKNLALQQKQLILTMLNIRTCTEQDIHSINFSFEFLKENLKIAPYFCIDSVEQSSIHTKEASNPLIKATAICQDRNALWCANLEDVFVVLDNYGNRPGTCFLGLFDGSNGISAAETTSVELPLLFLDQLSHTDSSYQLNEAEQQVLDSFHTVFRADYNIREKMFTSKTSPRKKSLPRAFKWIHKAYAMSFWRMDRLLRLGRNEVSKIRWSSCSVATCLVEICEKQHQQTQEGQDTLQRLCTENERNVLQQDLPERTVEIKSITAQQEAPLVSNGTTSSMNQQAEEPLERTNTSEENTIVEDSEQDTLQRLSSENERNVLQQDLPERTVEIKSFTAQQEAPPVSKETTSSMNQQAEEPLERTNTSEEKTIVEDSEQDTLQRLSSENERNVLQQDLPERIAEKKHITTQQEAPPVSKETTSSMNQQAEEPLGRTNKSEEKTIVADSEHLISNEDGLQGKDQLTNRSSSTQSNEGSAGVMHIANIGNVHIVLCKNGESYCLTKEHTTYSSKERKRVLQNGGHISSNEPKGMVEGVTKTTRGLGHHGNPQLKKTVIPVPHTVSIPVDDSCQFLILATNGLWEVLDKNQVVTLVLIMYSAFFEKYQQRSMAKSSKMDKDFEENFFSWYLKPDFFSEKDLEEDSLEKDLEEDSLEKDLEEDSLEKDLEEDSLEQSVSEIESPRSSGLVEEERIPSGFLGEQKINSPSKEASESCTFTVSTSEDTLTPSSSGSQKSPEKTKMPDKHQVFGHTESTDNQESSSQSEETDATTFYAHAAKYISKHLVKAALRAGSRDNITVLVALLNGCDKIPTYI